MIATPAVFAIFSLIAVHSYRVTNYIIPILELWEAVALVSVFSLMVAYVAPETKEGMAQFFGNLPLHQRDGSVVPGATSLRWFHKIWMGVFQILPTRLITFVLAEIFQKAFCYGGKQYWRSHTAVNVLNTIFLIICIVALVRFYRRLRPELSKQIRSSCRSWSCSRPWWRSR